MVNLNSKLNSLSKTISAFKLEVINMLGTIYIDFDILGIEEGNRLSIQKKQLLEDIVDVDGRINMQVNHFKITIVEENVLENLTFLETWIKVDNSKWPGTFGILDFLYTKTIKKI